MTLERLTTEAESKKNTLFSPTIGNTVTFYSDAYDDPNHQTGAYPDIFNAILNAKNTILISGWVISSKEIFHFTTNDMVKKAMTLSDLLAEKVAQNVKVIILNWNNYLEDPSGNVAGFSADIKKSIKNKVTEIADPTKDEKTLLANIFIKFSDTKWGDSDHAKMVVIDSKELYIGGLDLCGFRSDISTWHDCHAKVIGPAVIDAITLFEGRWKAQKEQPWLDPRGRRFSKLNLGNHQNAEKILLQIYQAAIDEQNAQIKPNDVIEDKVKPTVQLFVSLRKKYFFHANNDTMLWQKESYTNELLVEYVETIRKAKNFIYMENQFFIGPCKDGKGSTSKRSKNEVIYALQEKIIEKILANEPFHFYCHLPYRPEGSNETSLITSSLVLRKQWNTMDWFMQGIRAAVDKRNQDFTETVISVGDYITFFNMGFYNHKKTTENGFQMKYCHSKLMISDNRHILLGSANCNERSMVGNSDHEMCISVKDDPAILDYTILLMHQSFGNEVNDLLDTYDPGNENFYKAIKKILNQNLQTLEMAQQKMTKGDLNPVAIPWGNIPSVELEEGLKIPPHIINKTPIVVSSLQHISTVANKFTR